MEAPFFLVVNDDPKKGGGTGKKYPSSDEAVEAARSYLANERLNHHGYYICAPVKHVELASPPLRITDMESGVVVDS